MDSPSPPAALDLDTVRSFVAVAETLSFGRAAEQLGLSTPAITRRIQRLEAALGSQVLERSTRAVALSPAGRLFLPHAQAALAATAAGARAVQDAARNRAGHLILAALPTVTAHLLPRVIRTFRDKWPRVHLRVTECSAAEVVRRLHDGHAEFGFTFRGSWDAELAFEPVLVDPYCLIMPPRHALARHDQVPWRALKPHALITAGRNSGNMLLLNEALRRVDWRSDTAFEIDHLTTSMGLVEAGLGISVVPRSSLPPGPHPQIEVRPLIEPEVTRTLGLFWQRQRGLGAAARNFLQVARRVARELRVGAP